MDRTLDVYCFRLGANFQPKQCSKTNSIFVKLLENNFLGMSTFPLSMRKFKTYQIHALFGDCSKRSKFAIVKKCHFSATQ